MPAAVVLISVLLASVRSVITPGFYFADDTQLGALGQWYELGDHLLQGRLPVLSPQAWQAGNYFAEGQWGLLNPLAWLIAIAARSIPDALLVASMVKILFLAIFSLGVYLLASEFGASRPWAAVAGIAVPLGGFTGYMDAPSWVTGLATTSLFSWVWWSLLRVLRGRSPWPFLVASYLLITVGYVFGVIVLVFVLVSVLVATMMRRDWLSLRRAVLASVWAGLWTIVVLLPGVLTAPVTRRGDLYIVNAGFLNADLSDFGAAATPTASASIAAWFGPVTAGPLVYIAWFLPLVPLLAPLSRSVWRGLAAPVAVAAILLAIVLGPSDIGPLRWPVRLMPYLVIAVVVIFAVLATRSYPTSVTRRRALIAVALVVVMNSMAWAITPQSWRSIALCVLLQLLTIAALTFLAQQRAGWLSRLPATGTAVALFILVTAALLVAQMRVFPFTPLPTFAVPTDTRVMADVLADSEGDVMTAGLATAEALTASSYDERLIANLWYLSSAEVANTYTVLPFETFSDDLCMDLKGDTCESTVRTLFSTDPETGEVVADLLAVSEILGYTATYPTPPAALPDGWELAAENSVTWRVVRSVPVEHAGGVVWTGDGTRVAEVARTDESVSLRVEAVGQDGRVVFSRLAWPGYAVDGAVMSEPVRNYLLTVDVSGTAAGDIVTVQFRPAGFELAVVAAVLALLLMVAWPTLRLLQSVRNRDRLRTGRSSGGT